MFRFWTFRFRHSTVHYSERPKSERSDFGCLRSHSVVKSFGFRNPNHFSFGSFGFRTFHYQLCITEPKFPISDVFTKLDRFIYEGVINFYLDKIVWLSAKISNRTIKRTKPFCVRFLKQNVLCSVSQTELFVFGRLLYSQRLKTKRSTFRRLRKPIDRSFEQAVRLLNVRLVRTVGFQTPTKLDRFIYKNSFYDQNGLV